MKIKKIKPLFNTVITTAEKYDSDVAENGILVKTKGTLKEIQKVIAIGDAVRTVKVGDDVLINPTRYAVKKHQPGSLKDGVITDNPVIGYDFNVVMLNDEPCLKLDDRDIDYIVEEYEDDTPEESKLVLPRKKKLIVS